MRLARAAAGFFYVPARDTADFAPLDEVVFATFVAVDFATDTNRGL